MAHNTGKMRAQSRSFEIVLPATSANLGPAFDAAALAFSMYLRVRAKAADEFSVKARGRDSEICAQIENHLILQTYREVLQKEKKPVQPIALTIENDIPIGKGCGSSAAARLAGIALAVYFGRLRWPDNRIVYEAACRENHPDNAAACWMGGLAVARISANGEMQIANVKPKGKWPAEFCPTSIPAPTQLRISRIQCCCWLHSFKGEKICLHRRWKIGFISHTARRSAHCCRRCIV
jgi:homoserine kinase